MKQTYFKKLFLLFSIFALGQYAYAQPANNECTGAIAVTVYADQSSCVPTSVNTVGATQSATPPTCAPSSSDDDVWYSFTADNDSMTVTASNFVGGFTSIGFALYSGTCGALTELACNFNAGTTMSFTNLTPGTTYYLNTFTQGTSFEGTYDLCITSPPLPPANDNCAGAISVGVAADLASCSPTNVSTIGATESTPASSCAAGFADVWHQFTATTTAISASATNYVGISGSAFELYSSCGAASLACGVTNFTGLSVGTVYYLRTIIAGTGTFDLCVYESPMPPANDDCSGAIPLTVAADISLCAPTTANTAGATGATFTSACWSTSYDDDVWYSFTADTSFVFMTISNISVSGGTTGFSVLDACGGTELTCAANSSTGIDSIGGLTKGQTYYISVFYTGTTNRGTFDICLGNAPPPPPANDDCSGAIPLTVYTGTNLCAPATVNTISANTASYSSACWATSYDDDVWYSFTATNNYVFLSIFNKSVPSGEVGYSIFTASCAGAELICGEDASGTTDSISGLTIGETYYISIFYTGTTNRGEFDFCLGDNASVGIKEEKEISSTLSVSPNPSSGNINVSFKTQRVNDLIIKIIDLQGKEVYKNIKNSFSGEFNESFDLNNLSKGIYMLQIISDKEATTRKIVIQ